MILGHIFKKKQYSEDFLSITWEDELCIFCGRDIKDAPKDEVCIIRIMNAELPETD